METPTQASRKRAWCALHLFHGHDDEIDVPLGEILQENHFVEPTKQIGTAIWPINDPLNGLLGWGSWVDALQTWLQLVCSFPNFVGNAILNRPGDPTRMSSDPIQMKNWRGAAERGMGREVSQIDEGPLPSLH